MHFSIPDTQEFNATGVSFTVRCYYYLTAVIAYVGSYFGSNRGMQCLKVNGPNMPLMMPPWH